MNLQHLKHQEVVLGYAQPHATSGMAKRRCLILFMASDLFQVLFDRLGTRPPIFDQPLVTNGLIGRQYDIG